MGKPSFSTPLLRPRALIFRVDMYARVRASDVIKSGNGYCHPPAFLIFGVLPFAFVFLRFSKVATSTHIALHPASTAISAGFFRDIDALHNRQLGSD
jgi:hypothetical protein